MGYDPVLVDALPVLSYPYKCHQCIAIVATVGVVVTPATVSTINDIVFGSTMPTVGGVQLNNLDHFLIDNHPLYMLAVYKPTEQLLFAPELVLY